MGRSQEKYASFTVPERFMTTPGAKRPLPPGGRWPSACEVGRGTATSKVREEARKGARMKHLLPAFLFSHKSGSRRAEFMPASPRGKRCALPRRSNDMGGGDHSPIFSFCMQHFLYFRPLPQGQGSLGPTFFSLRTGTFLISALLAASVPVSLATFSRLTSC